jgi:uncharacterized protein YwqG
VEADLSLLQLDSDDHIFWGDTGLGHWFIRDADLRAQDFSRVEYDWVTTALRIRSNPL